MTITDNGWDSRAWLDGDWLHREPRRAEIRPRLLAETRLLPWLAPQLPLPVPIPEPTQYAYATASWSVNPRDLTEQLRAYDVRGRVAVHP
jgi:hypothetical protein